MSDEELQLDEMCVLESIYTKEEFTSNTSGEHINGEFHAYLCLPEKFHLLYRNVCDENSEEVRVPLQHLPPIALNFTLPKDYPSKKMPDYKLSCFWLPPFMLVQLARKLESLWQEQTGNVILFIWTNFLKDDSLSFLGIGDTLDISRKYTAEVRKIKCSKSRGRDDHRRRPPRTPLRAKFLNPRIIVNDLPETHLHNHLIRYNEDRALTEFGRQIFSCGICFQDKLGMKCIKFEPCGHVYCKECIYGYFEVRIKEGAVHVMPCPYVKCNSEASQRQIHDVVGPLLFSKYDALLLNATLNKMDDITYCPRTTCQCPVMRENDEKMATCPSCNYVFCVFCKMTYHGIEPCRLKDQDKKALVAEYEAGDAQTKFKLEKRYGKKHILSLLQNAWSEDWISSNSKACPTCSAAIEKNHGCNKMICWKCNCFFCWLCMSQLDPFLPYKHFNDTKSPCHNRLFHETEDEDDQDFFLVDFVDDDDDYEYDDIFPDDDGDDDDDDFVLGPF